MLEIDCREEKVQVRRPRRTPQARDGDGLALWSRDYMIKVTQFWIDCKDKTSNIFFLNIKCKRKEARRKVFGLKI